MSETMKEMRHRVAKQLCESNLGIPCTFETCGGCQRDVMMLRELQRAAMERAFREVRHIVHEGEAWESGEEPPRVIQIDALLDER